MRLRFFSPLIPVILAAKLILAMPVSAQSGPTDVTPANGTGVMPYQSYSGARENINLATGNLNLVVPVLSIPGRNGHDLVLNINYDSKIWQLQSYVDPNTDQKVYFWTTEGRPGAYNPAWSGPTPGTSMAWQLFFPALFQFARNTTSTVTCENYIVNLADGTKHSFPSVHTNCTYLSNGAQAYAWDRYVGDAGDGSFIRFDDSTGSLGIVSLKNGTKLYFPGNAPSPIPSKIEDTDGNIITYSTGTTYNHITSMMDTVGRQITFTYSTDGFLTGVSYYDSNGVQRTITLNYTQTPLAPTFTNPPGALNNNPSSANLLTSIVLPDNLSWTFRYNAFAELIQITYPSGGYTKYDYAAFAAHVSGQNTDFREVTAKHVCRAAVGSTATTCTVTEDTTTYTPTVFGAGNTQEVILDPLGNQTVVQLSNSAGGPFPYQTSRTIYQGASTVLGTIQTSYNTNSYFGQTYYLPSSRTTILDDGQQSQIQWDYDTYIPPGNTTAVAIDNVVERREYGFGAGAPGTLVRKTDYTWLKTNPVNNQDYTSNAIHIVDRKASEKVYDGASNLFAQTTYEYDNFTTGLSPSGAVQHDTARGTSYTTRGNLTATQRWRNTDGAWLTTRNQFNDAGNIVQTTDPGGHATTFSYADSWGNTSCLPTGGTSAAYPTSVTNALSQVIHSAYNSCSGTVASITDANSQVTTFPVYDSMNRLLQTNLPDGGQVSLTYSEGSFPLSLTSTKKITGLLNVVTTAAVDGVGRVTQSQLTSDPQGTDFTDSTYDALGRKSTDSNPYRTTSDSTYGITTFQYDALSRTTKVIPPDGSTSANNVTTVYAGNCVTVTDQGGKIRKSCSDGLGRLTQLFEPDASNNLVNETDYQYEVLNNLLRVDQKGNTTDTTQWRTRTFTYNSLSQLLSANNPESGTITYAYDNDGNLLTKTSPQANQTNPSVTTTISYCYDALHRLTGKAYTSQSCPLTSPVVSYFYDQASYNGLTISNGIGRRTGMSNAAGAEAWSYDVMGRPLTDRRTTNSVTKSTGYTYNLDGSMATLTYPSGRVVTYTVNAAGRAISAVDVANSINFATGASYTPPGALASLTNGASLVSTLYYNSRLQPCRISVRSAGVSPANCGDTSNIGNVLDFSYNFALGTADNGNVSAITNNRDTTRSQSFTYDTLNRIATSKTTATSGTNCWGETFSYDIWANLLSIGGLTGYSTCTQEMLNVGETVKNQISGNTYDAAGNLTASPPPASASYAYDAENRLTTTAGVTYTYDGDGKRVQKSNGKLYWYGAGSDPLDETDLAGNTNNASFYEYVFFSGKRIARRDFSGNAVYYFSDHLGTARVMTNNAGTVLDDSDFYPFGGERAVLSSSGNSYKFTTKERDSESTLDNFGARYFGSSLGRFMSPDPLGILSAETTSPQSLNLYSYVQNNPVNAVDPDGLDCVYVNDNSVSVVRGDCKSETDSGIFVNGTININSFTYNSQTQSLGFNFRNDDTGSFGVGVIAGVALSGGVSDADRFNAVVHGMQIAAPGVNLAANGLRAFGFVVAAPMMVIAECTAGSSLCTKGNIAMAILPEVGALRETALLLKEGAAAGKAAEILQKGGGMARAAKDFESLQGAEKVIGSTKIKTLADGTRAVLYQSKGGAPTLALQDAAGRTVTKIRY